MTVLLNGEKPVLNFNPLDFSNAVKFFKEDVFFQNMLFEGTNINEVVTFESINIDFPGYKITQKQYNEINIKDNKNLNYEKHDFRGINKEKLIVYASPNFYHFFMDTISHIGFFVKKFPDSLIIIQTFELTLPGYSNLPNFKILKNFLEKNNINYIMLDKPYCLAINNFYLVNCTEYSDFKTELIYDLAKTYIKNIDKQPTKKVFLSRRNVSQRIEDEEILEEFFEKNGFEIVVPENFKDFEEQANYFNEVHTLISATSAGIINSVFMKPGGKVVELIVPERARNFIPEVYLIHDHFLLMSFTKKHKYIGIRTPKKAHDIIEYIKSDLSLSDFIIKG